MYERSAIVLERYIEKILDFDKTYNLKKNSENYSELVNEIENYQNMTENGLKVMQEFDDIAKKIEDLQREQESLYKANRTLEDNRTQLFKDLGEDTEILESRLKEIESSLEENNNRLIEIREKFIQYLNDFAQKQKDRNKYEKARRAEEARHIKYIEKANAEFSEMDVNDVVYLKEFMNSEKDQIKQEVLGIMIKNGKNEIVGFNQEVLKKAIKARMDIAEKEVECYILLYDRMKKILAEIDSEAIKLNKYKKISRDNSAKLAFLRAEKEYIIGLLDYERMTAISSGTSAHKKMMIEACNNFELDMIQIKNLYELILKEISNKATKKAYKELYNKMYLRNIEDKEKNFQEEVNNVNISLGTVINSNYWRIEGIKNIYNVFQEEVTKKFGKDLSEYKIEEDNDDEELYDEKDFNENEYGNYGELYDQDDYEEDTNKDEYDEDEKQEKEDYDIFEEEDNIDEIIENSRRKALKTNNKKENKGLFNKLFNK